MTFGSPVDESAINYVSVVVTFTILTFNCVSFHTEDAARANHQRSSVQNSQRRPLLNHKLLVDVQLLQNLQCDVTFDGAKCSVNFLFVFLAGLYVMEIISVGHVIDGTCLWGLIRAWIKRVTASHKNSI